MIAHILILYLRRFVTQEFNIQIQYRGRVEIEDKEEYER